MSDESTPQSLYAARVPVFPRRVSGPFRTLKWWLMIFTLGIYYLTPWIRWDRGPNLPDQAVLIDLAGRRFYFFWIEIWPHEFYFVAGLLIMAGLGLFLFTSALGRVWCGYACPQTVWTDLFILVERWIEGDRNARVRLWNAPWTKRKVRLRATKYLAWAVIGLATGGAWVFYFADAPTLLRDLVTLQAHPVAYTTMAILTATTILFGGIAREQVCIYMCPWPRIQAAMMDPDTITVAYRDWRGEPRGKHNLRLEKERKAAEEKIAAEAAIGANVAKYAPTPFPNREKQVGGSPEQQAVQREIGDCIDCMACVNVCPMGIDIRNGQQLECITCALCIDACDEVMSKIGKPRGLIDYLALTDEYRERDGKPPRPIWKHVLRPRTILYTALWSLVGIGLVVALFIRTDIDVNVSPIRNPQFVTLADGTIRNVYDVRLLNKHGEDRPMRISLKGDLALSVDLEGTVYDSVTVPANETLLQRVYVEAPRNSDPAAAERTEFRFWVEDLSNGERVWNDSVFFGRDE